MRLYRKRKSNGTWVWWASWTENSVTVRRSTRQSTREAAEAVAARWELERADPERAATSKATLGAEALTYLRECKADGLAEDTLRCYEQKLGNVLDIMGRETAMVNVTAETVSRFVDVRRDEGASESTIYKEWSCLSGVLKSAAHRGRFLRVAATLRPPRLSPSYKPRETFLTWQQADALLAELEPERRRTVAYVLATGARRAEWMRAQGIDVDAKAGVVRLRGSKTEEADKVIPIPKPMLRWLKVAGKPPYPAWTNARRGIHRACVRAKVPLVTWNDLRRTFASLLAQAGVPPHLIGKLLRHTTSAMAERVYARMTTETLGDLVDGSLRSTNNPTVTQRKRTKRGKKRRGNA